MSPDTRAPEYKEADQNTAQNAVLPARRARQGVTGHNVRYVLVVSLLAVVVAFAITYTALVALHRYVLGFGLVGVIVAFLIVYLIFFG